MHKINRMQIKRNPVSFQPFGVILTCRIHVSLAIQPLSKAYQTSVQIPFCLILENYNIVSILKQ